jgi:hypothetical protein
LSDDEGLLAEPWVGEERRALVTDERLSIRDSGDEER